MLQCGTSLSHRCLHMHGKFASPRGVERRSNMLEASLFESQSSKKTRNPLTVVVSVIAHVVTVGILILIPLVRIEALIVPPIDMSMWLPHIEASKPVQVFSAQPGRVEKFIRVDPSALTS